MDTVKKQRATARGKFTRKLKLFEEALVQDEPEAILKSRFDESKITSDKQGTRVNVKSSDPPKFSGNIRDYPTFRKDYERLVTNNYGENPYALKSCLTGDALAVVRGVEDSFSEMVKRLDDKFGNSVKLIGKSRSHEVETNSKRLETGQYVAQHHPSLPSKCSATTSTGWDLTSNQSASQSLTHHSFSLHRHRVHSSVRQAVSEVGTRMLSPLASTPTTLLVLVGAAAMGE
ncbi:hypothetical protein Pmani_009766 [Petrolisthes manimaculis]|uniref:Uncharacterized protein n=1 Tax=Petrolisthes manimaculis TaxID=1843537 RepID=A0AAE1UDC6_9EUCA|nr:hypothetical protein Pmani_009766 [Petrolisthes manimaculis]